MNQEINVNAVLKILAEKLAVAMIDAAIMQARCDALEQRLLSVSDPGQLGQSQDN